MNFGGFLQPDENDPIRGLVGFLEVFDIRTAYPLLLAMFDAKVSEQEWNAISHVLKSYLLRRAVCNLGTKNYNRIFLALTRNLRADGFSAPALAKQLLTLTGKSGEWPDDSKFGEAWVNRPMYGPLNNPKLIHLLSRLESNIYVFEVRADCFLAAADRGAHPASGMARALAAAEWLKGAGVPRATGRERRRPECNSKP